jgi:Restriction endonuclease
LANLPDAPGNVKGVALLLDSSGSAQGSSKRLSLGYGANWGIPWNRQPERVTTDVIAIRTCEAKVRYLIECKRYDPEHKVRVHFVRALYGVKVDDKATKAFLATTSSFSRGALRFCENHGWELEPRDYEGVIEWPKPGAEIQAKCR